MNKLPINKIICGDCLEFIKELPDKCISLIVTDPPNFLTSKYYQSRKKYRSFANLGIFEGFFKQIFKELDRILRNNGFVYIFCNSDSYPIF